jgi:heme oxygenase (mycobilin-producing)
MHALITRIRLQDGQQEAFLAAWRETAAPCLREQSGCRSMYVLAGNQPDEVVAVSLWDSAEAFEAWHSSAAHREAHQVLSPFWNGAPERSAYDVREQI